LGLLRQNLFIRVLCVDDELFEGEKHLHLFFVNFRLKNVLEQDQFVKVDSEVVASDHHSDLSLDHSGCFFIDRIREVEIILVFCRLVVVLIRVVGLLVFVVLMPNFHVFLIGRCRLLIWSFNLRQSSIIFWTFGRSRVGIGCKVINLGLHLCHHFIELGSFILSLKLLDNFKFLTCLPAFEESLDGDSSFNDNCLNLSALLLQSLDFGSHFLFIGSKLRLKHHFLLLNFAENLLVLLYLRVPF